MYRKKKANPTTFWVKSKFYQQYTLVINNINLAKEFNYALLGSSIGIHFVY
ncbi:MAG: hypothetical protein BAJALOKI3v1_160006 [Promethearchaeota archaeon]|nr:MAG: hypothetical protein BAJALOKI3v1_160006 [Candidatus Lokiarchaeota archaeon]